MRRISFLFIGVITIIGCSSNEIPNYSVLNSEVSDTKSKTFYALEVATNTQLSEGDTKLLLNHLYDSIMSTKDYEQRIYPKAMRISVYEAREHFDSGMQPM